MNVLVTGGAGFIGSTLVDRLLGGGHSVVVVDSLVTGKLSNLDGARAQHGDRLTFLEHDIRADDTTEVVVRHRPEVVYHLAAQMDVRVSVADPVYDASVNIVGSLHVLEGARQAESRKFLFASSGGTIYGDVPDDRFPCREDGPKLPLSPYGITKLAFVDYLRAYKELHGVDYAALALGNVYGPRQDPHGEAGVVAIFAQRLLAGERCTLFGDATRDYVYVDDVVDAFVQMTERGTGLYNVGTGRETSTSQIYAALAAAAGTDQEPERGPWRPGELKRVWIDTSKVAAEVGWQATTALDEGARRVLDSLRPS